MGCAGPAKRRCGAVAYCSLSHQGEWERFKQQMMKAHVLSDFPLGFCGEATDEEILERRETRCARSWTGGVCMVWGCGMRNDRFPCGWDLPSALCPCKVPIVPFYESSWDDYCKWRDIPLRSPAALLLQWPLLIYWAVELVGLRNFSSGKQLYIHYLGPEKEPLQLPAFGELRALFPDVQINISFIGPAVPKHQDGETIELQKFAECTENECECKSEMDADTGHYSPVILHIRRGYYHDVYRSLRKVFPFMPLLDEIPSKTSLFS